MSTQWPSAASTSRRDIARGLNVSVDDAERLKTLYGACVASSSDDRESIAVHRLGDDMEHPSHLPKSELMRIIRPRVEEILELVRDRLRASGYAAQAGRRLVMTGGACQLTGMAELARAIISNQARIGRPLGVEGLPESGKSPAFAAAVGLMVYPQVAGLEYSRSHAAVIATPSGREAATRRGSRVGSRRVFKGVRGARRRRGRG